MKPIPFVKTKSDTEILGELYPDARLVRVSNDSPPSLPRRVSLWMDTGFDGFHVPESQRRDEWKSYIEQFPHSESFDSRAFIARPDKDKVQKFVNGLLDTAAKSSPAWLTIPQLPLVDDASRNGMNRVLASAASVWRSTAKFEGQFVFPIVITNQRQANKKTQRNKKINAIRSCLKRMQPHPEIVWLVDSSLQDQSGTGTFQRKRFPGIIDFHDEINEKLPRGIQRVGGPYWGLNLVLWARNLIDFPAIGLGAGYQYHVAGGKIHPPKVRVALPPLRRWAVHSSDLKGWLGIASSELPPEDAAVEKFKALLENFDVFSYTDKARLQIATFYREWHERLASAPPAGRALRLYQDLSSAYVLGKSLPDLPKTEGSARRPEIVAQQFMLNCL